LGGRGNPEDFDRLHSDRYIAHYPLLGRSLSKHDVAESLKRIKEAGELDFSGTTLGYDEEHRLWTASWTEFKPRTKPTQTVVHAVNAYTGTGGRIEQSWHWNLDASPGSPTNRPGDSVSSDEALGRPQDSRGNTAHPPTQLKLGFGGGRAWIHSGSFHFERGRIPYGKARVHVPLSSITSVREIHPGLAAYVKENAHSAVVIEGISGDLGRIPEMLPGHAKLLCRFLTSQLALRR
jgi:hypothetical protein